MNTTGRKTAYLVLCAGLLLFAGCKDLFHPDGPTKTETPVQYTVSYDANGATGTPPAAQTVNAGDSVSIAGQGGLTKAGHIFSGWSAGADGTGAAHSAGDSYAPAGSVILYAQWTWDGKYTVTFDADGGSPATQTWRVDAGGIVAGNMPPDPTRIHYIFDGWYTERNGGGTIFHATIVIGGDITVYAKWTIIQYTVTFDADGGNPTGHQETVNSGAWVGIPNMPSAALIGSVFGGWYSEEDGGGTQFYGYTPVTGNMTVYAKWTLDTGIDYTVTFNADGGSPTGHQETVTNGGSVGSSNMPANPTKGGYVFGGWYTAVNGGGTPFTAETTVIDDITVYARWTAQYTVTFNTDGGSLAPSPKTVLDGASIGVSEMPPDPAKAHYTFGGWYTAANGGGTQFTGSTVVTGDITVYAKWTPIQYTVTFNADGGSPATQAKTANSGGSVGVGNMPSEPIRTLYAFGGWYTAVNGGGTEFIATTEVSGNITVYAKWTALSLNDALTWINANAVEGGEYTITLKSNETIAPKTLSYSGKNVSITIMGNTAERIVSLSSTGPLFDVRSGVTLTLGSNVTLQGLIYNYGPVVQVSGGTLVMDADSKICGNTTSNTSHGCGVLVISNGTFIMNGGIISGNTSGFGDGGGVGLGEGSQGTFIMNGGTISGNTSLGYGGGVYIGNTATFTMNSGIISGNTAGNGGGVYVNTFDGGVFIMSGGTISDNTVSNAAFPKGGGVYVNSGTFTMSGGTISGNTAISGGGGVYVGSSGTFTKQSDGTIYGSNEGTTLKNTATGGDSYGHAVFVSGSLSKKRNTTAGAGVTLDSTVSGSEGGWE
ncbi:MAG: InlB B-repeat-containing protein [Treponema sp.]|jgi:uncharacterized repeat protein (TIGR02543 family)|nr:InlB B-repeat-containing protein [Treponema sp.]